MGLSIDWEEGACGTPTCTSQSGIVGDNGTGTAPEIATKWIGLRIGGGLAHSVVVYSNQRPQPFPSDDAVTLRSC